ncbi:MAG TPA: cytochrome-c oxidase, cbb3-type subunit III [Alphaproteobacteria bacterium]|nr:cytochrome-c oxidase, cbb3-type subunit III [Alphaproteobacteria bacterium]
MAKKQKKLDEVSGVETTGHEWDGLEELNNPMPRWWLIVFFITIVWSLWYWVIYPAWPTISGATEGSMKWTSKKELQEQRAEIDARKEKFEKRFKTASLEEIKSDPELFQYAMAGGQAAFRDNCAACHGTGATGNGQFPNLNDDDWLWGGSLEQIHKTISYGIRNGNDEAHNSAMPAFGKDGILTKDQIKEVAEFVININKNGVDKNHKAYQLFADNCVACHGKNAEGNQDLGAPNLADAIWLYGSEPENVMQTIFYSRNGKMPVWKGRLSDSTIKQLTVYVHSLGGGN